MLLKHSLIYFVARAVPGFINFLGLAIYSRLLDPEAFGRYALVIATVSLVQAVFFNWIRLGVIRFYQASKRDGKLTNLFSTSFSCFLFTALIVSIFWSLALLIIPINPELKIDLWIGLPLLISQSLFEQSLSVHIAALEPKKYGKFLSTRALLGFVMAISFIILFKMTERGLLLGLLAGTTLTAAIDIRMWWKDSTGIAMDPNKVKELLVYGLPLTLTFALSFVINSSDRFLIEGILGTSSVGLYAVGYDLANNSLLLIFMIVNLAAYPLALDALEKHGTEKARDQLKKNSILFFAVAFPATIGFALASPWIAQLVLGSKYQDSASKIMPLISIAVFFAGVKAFYFDISFQLGNRTIFQIWPVFIAAVLNIILNLVMLPIYGVIGAVYSSVISFAVAMLLSMILGFRAFPLPFPIMDWLRLFIAALIMAGVLLLIPQKGGWLGLILYVLVGILVFVTFVWVFKVSYLREFLKKGFSRAFS